MPGEDDLHSGIAPGPSALRDLDAVLAAFLDAARADAGALLVLDPDRVQLELRAHRNLPDADVAALRRVSLTAGAGRIATEAAVSVDGPPASFSLPMLTAEGELVGSLLAYLPADDRGDAARAGALEAYAWRGAEIVERLRLEEEARRRAARERRRTAQIMALARVPAALADAGTTDEVVRIAAEAAREILGTHQAAASRRSHAGAEAVEYVSLSDKYAAYRGFEQAGKGLGIAEHILRERRPLRLSGAGLVGHPEWRGLRDAPGHPPLPDYLGAPLLARDGGALGLIQVSDKADGDELTEADEAVLVQLASMAASAIEAVEGAEDARRERMAAEAEARLRGLLAEASTAFAASLDLGDTLEAIARITVPALADGVVVHLLTTDGTLEPRHAVHRDPDRERAYRTVLERFAPRPEAPAGPGAAARTGEPQLFRAVTGELIGSVAQSEEHRRLLEALEAGSVIVAPMKASGRVVGTLALIRDRDAPPYDEKALEFARELGHRAALALDAARRYAIERELATDLERTLAERERFESLLFAQKEIFEQIAKGAPLPTILEMLVRAIEVESDGDLTAVLLLRDGSGLRIGAAPGLPPELAEAIDGAAIDGASPFWPAVHRGERVVVGDAEANLPAGALRDLVLAHGFRSFWASPIVSPEGAVLGLLVIFYAGSRGPARSHTILADVFVRAAALAIDLERDLTAIADQRRLLEAVITQMPSGVLVVGPDTEILLANKQIEEYASEPLRWGGTGQSHLGLRPGGEPYDAEEWPLVRALSHGETVTGEEIEYELADGRRAAMLASAAPVRDEAGRLVAAVLTMTDVTERRQAERRLAAQHAVSSILSRAEGLDDALPEILASLTEALEWAVGALWYLDESGGTLRCVHVYHRPGVAAEEFLEATRRMTCRPGIGLPGRVWASTEPVWVEDVTAEPNVPRGPAAAAAGLRRAVGTPIVVGGRVFGVLELFGAGRQEADPRILRMLASIGGQIGQFAERRRAEEQVRAERRRLGIALEAGQMGTWDWDIRSGKVHGSESMYRIVGAPTRDRTFSEFQRLVHRDDRASVTARLRRAVETGSSLRIEFRIVRPSGDTRWLEARGQVVRDESGTVTGITGVALDITERKRAEDRLRRDKRIVETLHRVGSAVTARLDLQEVAQLVTDAATQLTGASYGMFLSEQPEGGGARLFGLSGTPPATREGDWSPPAVASFPEAFGDLEPLRLDDATASVALARNPFSSALPPGSPPVRSYLAVPVVGSDGRIIGGLFFGHTAPGRFTEDDERIASGIAAQASIAIENARLFEESRREAAARQRAFEERDQVARALQKSLLPPGLPEIRGVDLAARYRPAGAEVAGDFYDVFPLRGHSWGIVVGDVCGKGAEAAAITALTRHSVRTAAMIERLPSRILHVLNEALLQSRQTGRFCTALFGRLARERGRMRLTVAAGGHPPLLVLRADGRIDRLDHTGTLLGVFDEIDVADRAFDLHPGDVAVLYTDGLVEARNAGVQFGEERLAETLAGCRGLGAEEIATRLERASWVFSRGRINDDLAIVVVGIPSRVRPSP